MDKADLIKSIRAKMSEGPIEMIYPLSLFQRHGNGQLCKACDEPILGMAISCEPTIQAEQHWFHVVCDAVTRTMAAETLCFDADEAMKRADSRVKGC